MKVFKDLIAGIKAGPNKENTSSFIINVYFGYVNLNILWQLS